MAELRARIASRPADEGGGDEARAVLGFQERVFARMERGSRLNDAASGALRPYLRFERSGRFGGWVTFVKRRLLFPELYWLIEFVQENFIEQESINRHLWLAIEQLAIDNEALRKKISARDAATPTTEVDR